MVRGDRDATQAPATGDAARAEPAGSIAARLRSLRSRARALLLVEQTGWLVGGAVALFAGVVALDFVLRLPPVPRTVAMLGLVAFVAWWCVRRIGPAARFAPRLADVADRVESARPELRGVLASASDFEAWQSADDSHGHVSRTLAAGVVEKARAGLRTVSPAELLTPARAWRGLAAGGAALGVIVLASVLAPGAVATAGQRLLLPFSDAAWPRRFELADQTTRDLHPAGEALTLRAALVRAPRSMSAADVTVEWRLKAGESNTAEDAERGALNRALMTFQRLAGDTSDLPSTAGVFERPVTAGEGTLSYRFIAGDDRTDWRDITIAERPRITAASTTITTPDYAAALFDDTRRTADLGDGMDERAAAPVALAGSSARLELKLNRPARITVTARHARTGEQVTAPEADTAEEGSKASLTLSLDEPVRIEIALASPDGLESLEPAVFLFDTRADRAASVTIIEPTSDITVLPTARVPVRAEARDDVAIEAVAIERAHLRREAAESPTAAAGPFRPLGEPDLLARQVAPDEAQPVLTIDASATIDLAELNAKPGDRVRLVGVAADVRIGADALRPQAIIDGELAVPVGPGDDASTVAARSTPRTLRVIDEADFIEEVRDALAGVRDAAIRADSEQADVAQRVEEGNLDAEARRAQAQVGARVAQQRELVEELADRIEQNRLDDGRLASLIESIASGLDRAGAASERAASELEAAERARRDAEQAADEDTPEAEARAEAAEAQAQRAQEDAAIAQDEVRDELSAVARSLDQGEDDWAIRNELRRALERQAELLDRTRELAQEAAGRSIDELTEEQRAEAERIAADQQELAERAEDALEQMQQRADRIEDTDAVSSRSLREAAQNAQERGLPGAMENAAEDVRDNQTNEAQQEQQRAIEALEQALEDLDETERAREEVLQRLLASAVESIEALIAQQEAELARLAQAGGDPDAVEALAPGMIGLASNTLAVMDLLRSGESELLPVLNLVDRAHGSQTNAVRSLRARSADDAQRHESRSLALLRDALQRAERIDDQIEQEQQERLLDELRAAYTEMLIEAVDQRGRTGAIAEEAGGPPDDGLGRRERAALRRIAGEIDRLSQRLADVGQRLAELEGAMVVEFAHRRAVSAAGSAAESLREAELQRGGEQQDRLASALRSIVRSLAEPEADDRPFDDGQQQAGGQAGTGAEGQGPALPPAQQLTLLREIQVELVDRTRAADALPPGPRRVEALRELSREQRELSRVGQQLLESVMGQGGLGEMFPDRPETPDEPNDRPDDPPNSAPGRSNER